MKDKVKTIIAIALPVQIVLVKWMAAYPDFVETYYSNGLYPPISQFSRLLLGWIPFSVGDLFYLALGILAIRYFYKYWKSIKAKPLYFLKDVAVALSITYFAFHLLWGMNYYRQPITWKLGMEREYTLKELTQFTQYLAKKTNAYQQQITGDSIEAVQIPYSRKGIFKKTEEGYAKLKNQYPNLEYKNPSLKSSIFSVALTYMGYGGYLNPFTNEAQVNGITPLFRMPTVSGHEVGHQLGYSAEDATNFIGYLVTVQNDDPYFKYAAYHNALGYCLSDLSRKDEQTSKQIIATLHPGVKKNFQELRDFWEQYQNPLEPVFKSIFNTFLKINNQKEGIHSYNSVVGLMINFHFKKETLP
jgi:succinate dehydrogenase/fumarate reductase cytochrome b subunit